MQDSGLRELSNVGFANVTNFPVTSEQRPDLDPPVDEADGVRFYIAAIGKDHPGTWERCKELASWGSPNHSRLMEGVHEGDQLLIWQGGQGFMATARITGPYQEVTPTEENDWGHEGKVYPYRFPLEPVAEYAVPVKPAFPGTRPDPEFGIATVQLKSGFAQISKQQFDTVLARLQELNAPKAWLILQSPGSTYGDVEGVAYHYPLRIPNARRIHPGDAIVVCRPAKQVDDGGRLACIDRAERTFFRSDLSTEKR